MKRPNESLHHKTSQLLHKSVRKAKLCDIETVILRLQNPILCCFLLFKLFTLLKLSPIKTVLGGNLNVCRLTLEKNALYVCI